MPTRPIQISNPIPIDFGEYFEDESLVRAAIRVWASDLRNAVCYCLRFKESYGDSPACFEPYGSSKSLNGCITDSTIDLPKSIPYQQLISQKFDGSDDWPILAEWLPGDASLHPPELFDATWHVEARIESNGRFVGYFKAAIPDAVHRRNDSLPIYAFQRTSRFVNESLVLRRVMRAVKGREFEEQIDRTVELTKNDLASGKLSRAFQRLASVVTFHLGAGLNRIAIFQEESGIHRCVYAHGGDCSKDFSDTVQKNIASGFSSIDGLQDSIGRSELPIDDPLYVAAIKRSCIATGTGNSVLDLLIRNNGDFERIAYCEMLEILPESHLPTSVAIEPPLQLAALMRKSDTWFTSGESGSIGELLACNRNNTFAVVPWKLEERLVGLVLVDQGYWEQLDDFHDLLPKIAMLRWILERFGTTFIESC